MLNRLDIPCTKIGVGVDTSYNLGFTKEEKPTNQASHSRCLVKLHDEKYDINGIFLADPTWDNFLEDDLYLNSLMTFDRKKEAISLEFLNDEIDLLLDFHNPEEFNKKINYYLKRKFKDEHNWGKNEIEKIIRAYKSLYQDILETLQELDPKAYQFFHKKYNQYFDTFNKISLKELEPIAINMLTEYGNYILPLSNQKNARLINH